MNSLTKLSAKSLKVRTNRFTMQPMQQVSFVIPPTTKIFRLWLGWTLLQNKSRVVSHPLEESDCDSNLSRESLLAGDLCPPVPKGFLAVYVGPELKRFVIPMSYLSMSEFRVLMDKAEEEFGFEQEGALQFPCNEQDFEKILVRCKNKKKNK